MTSAEQANLDRAIAWVRAIESGATGEALSEFVTLDVIHEDMPNRVFPNGMRYDLAAMRAGAERDHATPDVRHRVGDRER